MFQELVEVAWVWSAELSANVAEKGKFLIACVIPGREAFLTQIWLEVSQHLGKEEVLIWSSLGQSISIRDGHFFWAMPFPFWPCLGFCQVIGPPGSQPSQMWFLGMALCLSSSSLPEPWLTRCQFSAHPSSLVGERPAETPACAWQVGLKPF